MATQHEELQARIGINTRQLQAGLNDAKKEVGLFAKAMEKINGPADALNKNISGLRTLANILPGIGIAGLLGGVVTAFVSAASAAGDFFGKISVGGMNGERALQVIGEKADFVKKKFSELNKARWQEEKDLKEANKGVADARLDDIKEFETIQEKVARLTKEYADAELKATLRAGLKGSEIAKNKEAAIRKQTELQKALTDQQEEAAKKKEKSDKDEKERFEKNLETKKKIAENDKETDKAIEKRNKFISDSERKNNEQYLPTIDELASFNGGQASRDARRIQFLVQDTKLANLKGNFAYAKNNVSEIDRLKEGLKEKGFLPKDSLDEIASTSKEMLDGINELIDKGLKLQDR